MKNIIIVGAGPAGLSCAYKLVRSNGYNVKVLEASSFIGGMSRSFNLWGQRVDLGPHRFFSKQNEVNQFFDQLIGDDFTVVDRQTRIFYNGKYFDYPIKIGNVLSNVSILTIIQILGYYFISRINPIKNPRNFEEWVSNKFGKKLYEIFFKHYSEKLWGVSCDKIDSDWAAQRIKKFSLSKAIKLAFRLNKGNSHATLVDQFKYPKNGTGTIYERAADYIKEHGGMIQTNSQVKRVLMDEKDEKVIGVELGDGTLHKADYIISTMPLTSLLKGLKKVPEKVNNSVAQLKYRNTILVYFEIDNAHLFTDNWLYIHSPEVGHGRITNFKNWCDSLNRGKNTSIICLEYWCFSEDTIWNCDDAETIAKAKEEILKIDLIPNDACIINSKVFKVPRSYPLYAVGYQKNIEVIKQHLSKIQGLYPIGRYGSFKYNNQDHSILMGLLAAKKIFGDASINLWQINTDTEYQESGELN